MSQTEFETYWREIHGRLTITSKPFSDARIQRYTQVHNSKPLSSQAENMGLSLVEFEWDACSELYVTAWEDYLSFATSDEMRNILGPDGARVIHPEKGVRVMVSKVDPVYIKSVL